MMKGLDAHGTGHLSHAQLCAIADGRAGEETRLQAGEHLAECDACMEAYLALLEQTPLLVPAAPADAKVRQVQRRRRAAQARVLQVGVLAAAACLAVVVWGCSAGHPQAPGNAPLDTQRPGFAQQLDDAARDVADVMDGLFSGKGK